MYCCSDRLFYTDNNSSMEKNALSETEASATLSKQDPDGTKGGDDEKALEQELEAVSTMKL